MHGPEQRNPVTQRWNTRFSSLIHLTGVVLLAAITSACTGESAVEPGEQASDSTIQTQPMPADAEATYVGSENCASCHETQWQSWQNSHHDLALQRTDGETVLAELGNHSNLIALQQTDSGYTAAPGGNEPALPVVYTFGVEPLQQYVVDTGSGRLQVLPTPWDTRDEADGGQRFYELYPGNHPPGDPMHWTGRANSWNGMCADCHSTAVEKNYDPATRSYQTVFAVEDVGCEACHGPGSLHAEAAGRGEIAALPALRTAPETINVCAQCHSRRSQLAEGFQPAASYFDHYLPSLLRSGLYHPDGQILDEVYVYGSFLQSRMHLAGVSCSDCHDPHSAEIKTPGNAICTQCHNPQGRSDYPSLNAGNYDDPAHHHHAVDTPAAQCVNCHMTSQVYMGIDDRRDHSFRIPRPDLSAELGTPNACASCHEDLDESEINAAFVQWSTPQPRHHGQTFASAQRGELSAEAELAGLAADDNVPIMVRANAVSLMAGYSRGYALDTIRVALRSPEPLMRIAATEGLASLSPETQWRYLLQLLEDERLAVRNAAFTALMPMISDAEQADRLRPYLNEYLTTQALTGDFPESLVNSANAYIAMNNIDAAELKLEEALQIQPSWVPALLNLADLYRATLRDDQAEPLLREAIEVAPELPETSYSYALWLTRSNRSEDAVSYFQQAADYGANDQRYGYTLALALNSTGQGDAAVSQLEQLLARWPQSDNIAIALVTILRDQGKNEAALKYLEPLLQRNPQNTQLLSLQRQLQRS